MIHVDIVPTEELGDRSYVVHDGQSAVVVDPQRDIDRVQEVLDRQGLQCALVVETHVHNDYVTGGYQLAGEHGAPYAVHGVDPVAFERRPVRDGEELRVGSMAVRAVSTPGHTDTHLSFVVSDGDGPPAVFTGGSLLYGSVGRTDLVDAARTVELTHAQYRSARRLAELLPDDTAVYPTHGFGSFCSSGAVAGGDGSTIGVERDRNDALVEPDEDAFVTRLVANLTAYPAYYAHMDPRNRQGPGPIDLSPLPDVDPGELAKRMAAGEWVVDLRDRTVYAAEHVSGTVGIALGPQFATWLGWVMPWGTPVTLIGASPGEVAAAQRQLVRIGIDRPAGRAVGPAAELAVDAGVRGYPTASFGDVVDGVDGVVLDVRRDDERVSGAIPGSVHVPLHDLLARLDELPERRLWVHCASGYRASIAASLLDRAGRDVVLVDDEYDRAVELGLTASG